MALSPRLRDAVDALELRPGMRVLEVGGAPGAAAREVTRRIGEGFVLVVDRSPKGVELTRRACADEIAAGVLEVRQVAVEDARLEPGEAPYDLAFACRVGVLDGRHPQRRDDALASLRAMLVEGAPILIDPTTSTRS
ncbi:MULTISPECIES: SAM-dependent methyltransferase [unclassified Knoellia]|uniref:SAM-dependent methyltransferase n=1 Tax=Knoellia altitudinis TaxID=3404795 RepID=UPI00360A2A22